MSRAAERRKRPAVNALNAMATGPWAILPEKLDVMIQIASRENLPVEAIEATTGEPLEHTYMATIRDGVALIPIEGPMFKRADWFSRISGATSYVDIATDFTAALEDPEVRAIILNFDSEGGQVSGCSELARMIYDARGRKPIIAYVEGICASAALWLASACDEIVAADTALVGSLGCVLAIDITKKQDEMLGIEHIEIVSSQTPNKRVDPTKAAGRAQLQALVDELAGVFISAIGEYRAIAEDQVAEQYGAGKLFVGASAVESGLADRLGSYESLLAELSGGESVTQSDETSDVLSPPTAPFPATAGMSSSASRPNTTPVTETAMSTRTQPAGRRGAQPRADATPGNAPDSATPGNGTEPGSTTEDQHDEELETPAPAGAPVNAGASASDATAAAVKAAAAAERKRVLEIQALGRAGEEKIIASCIADPDCTPAMAALKLRQAEPNAAARHLAALSGDEHEAPAPSATTTTGELSSIDAAVEAIVNAGKSPATPSAKR